MQYGVAKTGLENLKETLKYLDHINKLMQTSMGGQTIIWKLLDLLAHDQKDNSPSAPDLMERYSHASWWPQYRTKVH